MLYVPCPSFVGKDVPFRAETTGQVAETHERTPQTSKTLAAERQERSLLVVNPCLKGRPLESWDLVRALDSVGGDVQFLDELAGIFCAAYPTLLKNLEESVISQSQAGIADAAHLLGSAARSLASSEIANAAFSIEAMAERNEFDAIEDAYHALRAEVERLGYSLTKFRNGKLN
jgi:HPt (histidine-containing phosphotransfer) domain-containing protein